MPRGERVGTGIRHVPVSTESLIRSHYAEWRAAIGSEHLIPVLARTLAPDFVYTDPAVVLLGRDVFFRTLPELQAGQNLEAFDVTVRDMGAHAVAAGACSLVKAGGATAGKYVFSALWRRVDGTWLCVAHRGAPTLLSGQPVRR